MLRGCLGVRDAAGVMWGVGCAGGHWGKAGSGDSGLQLLSQRGWLGWAGIRGLRAQG